MCDRIYCDQCVLFSAAVDSDSGREIDCQLCGAWFETRKGLSSHARAHLRHLGVSDPDAKGSPIDVLNDLIKSEDFKGRPPSLLHSERETLGETGSSDGPSPKSTATAAPATGMKQAHAPRPLGKQPSVLSPHSPPPSKKLKPHGHRLSAAASLQRKQGLSSSAYWAADAEMAPLNLCRFYQHWLLSPPLPLPLPSLVYVTWSCTLRNPGPLPFPATMSNKQQRVGEASILAHMLFLQSFFLKCILQLSQLACACAEVNSSLSGYFLHG